MITFLIAATGFMLGANVTLYVVSRTIIDPMRKSYREALNGWEESIKMLRDVTGIQPDGSIKSPIQIHKHE